MTILIKEIVVRTTIVKDHAPVAFPQEELEKLKRSVLRELRTEDLKHTPKRGER